MTTIELITESNKIEGITRRPTGKEIEAFENFLCFDEVTIGDLQRFVNVYQPNTEFRDKPGMDVRVGNYRAPRGGIEIREELDRLLRGINAPHDDRLPDAAWEVHTLYERLHPFLDCNGRSGRMLWYWMMRYTLSGKALGFLHMFYYQTLNNLR